MTKLCAVCWGKITEEELIIDPEDNEYLHPECAECMMKEEGMTLEEMQYLVEQ